MSMLGDVGSNIVSSSVEYGNTGFAAINGELMNASSIGSSIRDGVTFYTDDVPNAGADDAVGY